MRLVTASEMQEIDRRTIQDGHVPSLVLMESAGRAAAGEALQLLSGSSRGRVEVLCGKGNNGGDGLVAARWLAAHGARVRVHLTHPKESMSPDAREHYEETASCGVEVRVVPAELDDPGPMEDPRRRPGQEPVESEPNDDLASCLASADLVLDGLLGTGIATDLSGRLAAIVNLINHNSRKTLALDIPSGIDATSGRVRGTAVWADLTVTFALPKLGLALFPGRERAGRLVVADIGIPTSVVDSVAPRREWVDRSTARALLPRLEPTAHKYARGCVLVIAGSRSYPGAAALAAEAALRAGAGIVYLLVPESVRDLVRAKLTEGIVFGAPDTPSGGSGAPPADLLSRLLSRADALAIGPGLGDDPSTRQWVRQLLDDVALPAAVDADAIPALPGAPHRGPRIVTPHAGELARWIRRPAAEVAENRMQVAAEVAAERQVTLVAKGAPTFVAAPDGALFVNGSGNAGLATAGSGDVLAGILGSLLAQGLEPSSAAALGVYVHGLAADVAARGTSPRSLIASDFVCALGRAYLELER